MSVPTPATRPPSPAPVVPLRALETLWLQVTGTLCNLACRHCFISCGPKNDNHPFMTVAQVARALDEARSIGVKEYYFTGGEPFMHPQILELIDMTLAQGPLSILTNGVLIDEAMAHELGRRFREARYSFDLRVSLDGVSAEANDPLRGRGTFDRIIASIRVIADVGLNPVITITETDGQGSREEFIALIRSLGLDRPRLKFLAPFRIGREARRDRPYDGCERLAEGDLLAGEEESLQCGSCRAVAARGVWPCPILVEHEDARMGGELADGLAPVELKHAACHTCHVSGISCRT